jgi:hypothetical protein
VRNDLLLESERLTRSWAHHEPSWLRDYLVAGVEDPRLNVQSILTRHFVIRTLTGNAFERLMVEEYRFAATMRWLLDHAEELVDPETCTAVLHALDQGADNAEGVQVPPFISAVFKDLSAESGLGIPNYLRALLYAQEDSSAATLDSLTNTFAELWSRRLPATKPDSEPGRPVHLLPATGDGSRPTLIEPACGSANDYRFLHRYGISRLIDYKGFDLCQANVDNARELFPDATFERGNVFDIKAPDKSFDLCVVHDLFEHFSLAGLEQAVREVCRVTRRGICVGFFQMDEIAQHLVRPVDDYHWNLLSMSRTRKLFRREGFAAQVIHIDTFLSEHATGAETHNPNAYTFILQRA